MQVFCEKLFDSKLPDKTLLRALYKGLNVYFNYTGTASCLDISSEATSALGDMGWDYQVKQRIINPTTADSIFINIFKLYFIQYTDIYIIFENSE